MDITLLLQRIEAACKAAGITVNKAGEEAGVGRDFVRDMKRRGSKPSVVKLRKLALRLRVPFEWLSDAVDADEAERAKGSVWAPHAVAPPNRPERGQFVEDPDELSLLAFWRSLNEEEQHFMTALLRNGALSRGLAK